MLIIELQAIEQKMSLLETITTVTDVPESESLKTKAIPKQTASGKEPTNPLKAEVLLKSLIKDNTDPSSLSETSKLVHSSPSTAGSSKMTILSPNKLVQELIPDYLNTKKADGHGEKTQEASEDRLAFVLSKPFPFLLFTKAIMRDVIGLYASILSLRPCMYDAAALLVWERTRLHLFQFSLRDQASNVLQRLPAGSISTWEDLTTCFLAQFFPPRRIAKLRNDILIILKAITDRITGALPSNTIKNPKLNVNSTSPVLSARSYLTEDPQCSTCIHSSINAITKCFKKPNKSGDNKPGENGVMKTRTKDEDHHTMVEVDREHKKSEEEEREEKGKRGRGEAAVTTPEPPGAEIGVEIGMKRAWLRAEVGSEHDFEPMFARMDSVYSFGESRCGRWK
ncbi:zinc finger, CCHC-type containing protein [Tanacetum coccineum]